MKYQYRVLAMIGCCEPHNIELHSLTVGWLCIHRCRRRRCRRCRHRRVRDRNVSNLIKLHSMRYFPYTPNSAVVRNFKPIVIASMVYIFILRISKIRKRYIRSNGIKLIFCNLQYLLICLNQLNEDICNRRWNFPNVIISIINRKIVVFICSHKSVHFKYLLRVLIRDNLPLGGKIYHQNV